MGSLVELEVSNISPPPASVPATSLPLSFFDIRLLGFPAVQLLLFYEYPHPTSHFMQTTLPTLKSSLSLTLQHFFPLAAKLLLPPSPQLPYFLYSDGDSVPLTVKETTADFTHLAGNHARHVKQLEALAPNLPAPSMCSKSGCMEKPMMAIQITLFPDVGMCIGFAFCHGVADGRSFAHFMKSWAWVHRCEGDVSCLNINNSLPNFDRDQIKDPLGGLASLFMEGKRELEVSMSGTPYPELDNFQFITFTIKRLQVEFLKDLVAKKWVELENNKSEALRISTFAVTCAYMWVCLVKLHARGLINIDDNDDEICYFLFSADCRERLKLPGTYFGNCIALRFVSAKKSALLGENGVLVAAKAIGREILELDQGVLKEVEKSSSRAEEIRKAGNHTVMVMLSPKFSISKTDFGWGRPTKTHTNVAVFGSFWLVSIIESREDEGGVEFGLAFNPNHDLDGFNAIFHHGLS